MRFTEDIEVKTNLDIILIDRGKRKLHHHRTHNIVLDTGRQFLAENITPDTLGVGTFTRSCGVAGVGTVARYIGFGIGGTRQSAVSAYASPYSDAYPAGYGGTNAQTDVDAAVFMLERPVKTTGTLWMQELVTPGTFPDAKSTTFKSLFGQVDINISAPFASVPISEIGLYKSSADPLYPNGQNIAYPGAAGHMIAYDTFDPIRKTGLFDIEVRWTWRF